ncbi:MAG: hypothetical protein WBC65_14270 [Ignavibacteria bacterium]
MTNYKLRIQIIAPANDDGSDAANITPSQVSAKLETVNEILAPANIEFIFDETNDFLKIHSTLINREFTPLELPNVGNSKWDHEPTVDSQSHTRARTNIAMQFPGKLTVIFRNRKKLDTDDNGNWEIVNKGGGSSSANSHFVNMSTISNGVDLAHEIGHYLQLPHTFVGGVEKVSDAAALIKEYVEDGHDEDEGMTALDGDRNVVLDTPGDCKSAIFESEDLDPCGEEGEITIPVNFGESIRLYTLAPDRNLVMSYFKGCSETGDKTISPQQARRIRDGLELRHRHDLISSSPSFNYSINRGGSATGGEVSEVEVALVRAGRIAAAVRDGNGDLKVIVFDISDAGKKVTRRGSESGGAVSKISVCGLGQNLIATAVITSSKKLKIIIWRIEANGNVMRLGDASGEGEVNDVACCISRYNLGNNYMATAVRMKDGTMKVNVWETYVNGTLKHRAEASAGKINVPKSGITTPRLSICIVGANGLLTSIRDESHVLKSILWEFDDDKKLRRSGSIEHDEPSTGWISGGTVGRSVAVTAFQNKDKGLRLQAYGILEEGRFIEMRGSASAGSIGDVSLCRLGTEMVMTGLRVGADKLKLILWNVTKSGDHIIRLCDKSASDVYSKLSMCHSDRNQLITAMRDNSGNLKVVCWYLLGKYAMGKMNSDHFKKIFEKAKPERITSKKAFKARGGDCGN